MILNEDSPLRPLFRTVAAACAYFTAADVWKAGLSQEGSLLAQSGVDPGYPTSGGARLAATVYGMRVATVAKTTAAAMTRMTGLDAAARVIDREIQYRSGFGL